MKRILLVPLVLLMGGCLGSSRYTDKLVCYTTDGAEYFRVENAFVVPTRSGFEVYQKEKPKMVVTGNCVMNGQE